MMKAWLGLAVLLSSMAHAEPQCLGDPQAKHQLIYFHGMDEGEPGKQEQENRDLLARLAKDLSLRIALPRGQSRCKGQRCWESGTKPQLEASYQDALRQAKTCIAVDGPFHAIGFSNGGYFISKIFHNCLTPQPQSLLAIASAGVAPDAKTSLKNCGHHGQLIGDRDITLNKAKTYDRALKKLAADTTLQIFRGGHRVPEAELRQWLQSVITKPEG